MHQLLKDTIVNGLKRKAIGSCTKWASNYRMMGRPYAGKWSSKYHPWIVGMQNSNAHYNVGMKSAQMGYTESLLNITLFHIDIHHRSVLYVLPTKNPGASNFSSSRFDVALELSNHLKEMFTNVKNVNHKRSGSANLFIRGSNSRADLKSDPVSIIAFDEYDEMNMKNISLAEERVSGQPGFWQIWKISTPTAPKYGIHKEFLTSTQEHFVFKCPHCSKYTELIFPDCFVIAGDNYLDAKIKESYIICKECKRLLKHEDKINFLTNGIWVPFGEKSNEHRGFYINQLYSMATEPWQIAELHFKAEYDKAAEQELWNSKMGLPHVPDGANVTNVEFARCIGNHTSNDPIPNDCKLITMGVDQGKWLHYEIGGWTFPKLGNDLNMIARCKVLAAGKVLTFEELGQLMRQWQIIMCVIDAQPERRKAYEFACKYWGNVKLCFYTTGVNGKMINEDPNEETHKINVDKVSWLDVGLNRFHNNTIILPKDITIEYKEQIQALVRRYETVKGEPIGTYLQTGPDHLAHARCYDEIALPCAAKLTTNENIRNFL